MRFHEEMQEQLKKFDNELDRLRNELDYLKSEDKKGGLISDYRNVELP